MKNKFVFSLVLTLVWLSVCGVTCHPYDDMNFESLCWSNFHWSVWVPDGDSVWTEVYSGDTLLDVDSMMSPVVIRAFSILSSVMHRVTTLFLKEAGSLEIFRLALFRTHLA